MSDYEDTTQEKSTSSFDMSSCMEMMGKMASQGGCSCDCGEVMSQVNFEAEIPSEWGGMMTKMMESCFGGKEEKAASSEEVVEEG